MKIKNIIRNRKPKNGFSLIEVAVALTLLALVSGGMLAVFNQGFAAARKTQQRTFVYSLAREKIEEKFATNPWPAANETRLAVSGFAGFEREVVVSCPYLGFNDLARINVTVWWDNGARSQTLETLKANY